MSDFNREKEIGIDFGEYTDPPAYFLKIYDDENLIFKGETLSYKRFRQHLDFLFSDHTTQDENLRIYKNKNYRDVILEFYGENIIDDYTSKKLELLDIPLEYDVLIARIEHEIHKELNIPDNNKTYIDMLKESYSLKSNKHY